MRAWAARRIRDGIRLGRRDAELVALFGDKPMGRKLDGMFRRGELGPTNWLTAKAHSRVYERELRVWRGLSRLLSEVDR